MLLAEFGPQTRPENQSRIKSPSQNPGQDSGTLRHLRSGKLAASLSVHGWRESHVTPSEARRGAGRGFSSRLTRAREKGGCGCANFAPPNPVSYAPAGSPRLGVSINPRWSASTGIGAYVCARARLYQHRPTHRRQRVSLYPSAPVDNSSHALTSRGVKFQPAFLQRQDLLTTPPSWAGVVLTQHSQRRAARLRRRLPRRRPRAASEPAPGPAAADASAGRPGAGPRSASWDHRRRAFAGPRSAGRQKLTRWMPRTLRGLAMINRWRPLYARQGGRRLRVSPRNRPALGYHFRISIRLNPKPESRSIIPRLIVVSVHPLPPGTQAAAVESHRLAVRGGFGHLVYV